MKSMKNKKRQPKTKKQTMDSKAAATQKTLKPEKRTIKLAVIEAFAANASVTNAEMIAAVKTEFPKSAFDERHAAWYRSQARKGLLTGAPIAIPVQTRK